MQRIILAAWLGFLASSAVISAQGPAPDKNGWYDLFDGKTLDGWKAAEQRFIGRPLLDRLGPNGAVMLAAAAGVLRWTVSAETAALPMVAMIQPLHGLTFALLHLACMRRLAEIVPPGLSATALTLYGTVGIGAASALLTLASGTLYGAIGADGFWVMAALCAIALPLARRL